jgi:hypothetical protein
MGGMEITFGDRVRVISEPSTISLGIAGLIGDVQGETKPSATGVKVVGASSTDWAFSVRLAAGNYWLDPGLLEFVDHSSGSEITLDGVPKKWIRSATGEWVEIDLPNS